MTPDEVSLLLSRLSETDAPPWTEIGPQEHGESDVETAGYRYGPMPRETAEMMAAAPDMANTIMKIGEVRTSLIGKYQTAYDNHRNTGDDVAMTRYLLLDDVLENLEDALGIAPEDRWKP